MYCIKFCWNRKSCVSFEAKVKNQKNLEAFITHKKHWWEQHITNTSWLCTGWRNCYICLEGIECWMTPHFLLALEFLLNCKSNEKFGLFRFWYLNGVILFRLRNELIWEGSHRVIGSQWVMRSKLKWGCSGKARGYWKWSVVLRICFSVC